MTTPDVNRTKISDLASNNIVRENHIIPINVTATDGSESTERTAVSDLRKALRFDNAFTNLQLALTQTVHDEEFFVFEDATAKEWVLGWRNHYGSALAVNDKNNVQLRLPTEKVIASLTTNQNDLMVNTREGWEQFLGSLGLTLANGSFEEGSLVNNSTAAVWSIKNAQCYTYSGELPITIPPAYDPLDNPGWISQKGESFRKEIFGKNLDWVTPDQFYIEGEIDYTNAFVRALSVSRRIKLMAKTYYVNSNTILTSLDDIHLIGEGSAHSFIIANTTGDYLVNFGGNPDNPATVRERISIRGVTLDGANLANNTLITCASQSPDLINDVVVRGAVNHGMVHTRGWSTFARGLVCRDNGGQGLRLEGDNNNTHWEGMWAHNGTIGVYVLNAAAVTFKGSIENNGEQGGLVTATANKKAGFYNVESSVVSFDGVYFESNGKKTAGTYSEIQFGGDDGTVRDCSLKNCHIGVPSSGIGVQISQKVAGLAFDTVGIYSIGSALAHIRFSGAYATINDIISSGCTFKNINVNSNLLSSQGFVDSTLDIAAFILGGGTQGRVKSTFQSNNIQLNNDNNSGTYLERIFRGSELISERGVKPNVQVWNNAGNSVGFHSFAVAGTEVFRIGATSAVARVDNGYNLGAATIRWANIYAATGAINTSDERLKKAIPAEKNVSVAEANAALEIKKSIYRFNFEDALLSKGKDGARIHFGVGAQTVREILAKYELNAADYAFWCHDTWEAEEAVIIDGIEVVPAKEAGDRYGIRYDELCMFIMAYV